MRNWFLLYPAILSVFRNISDFLSKIADVFVDSSKNISWKKIIYVVETDSV